MLRALRIQNVAVVDEMALDWEPGLNVLTGETGAGKSIITRSIALLCGERAYTDLIRADAEEAQLEGVFDLTEDDQNILADCGLEKDSEVVIRRIISRSGKSKIHVNGSLATAALLSQLGGRLIHVYGQHEQTLLLRSDSHLDLLDEYGSLHAERAAMAQAYASFRHAADQLAKLMAGTERTRQRLDLLRFQSAELRDAQVRTGEEAELQQERERQRHAEKLGLVCQQGEDALYGGDESVSTALARVLAQVEEAARIDAELGDSAELLRQAKAQIDEVALNLRRAAERIEHDPERLAEIEERLALLGRLKRKYDCEADLLPERLAEIDAELAELDAASSDASAWKQQVRETAGRAWAAARELSKVRQEAASQLEERMAAELRALGMSDGVFRAVFTVSAKDAPQAGWADTTTPGAARLTELGADTVEFYLSANPGEAPKPLARIASGGELSRIMLALKTLTAGAGEARTLLFDEVDAGIGGTVADAVGRRLHALARSRQILCITHLPQIAALADHHFAVEKRVVQGRTVTSVRALSGEDRVRELARMLGGTGVDSERYARRLLQAAASK